MTLNQKRELEERVLAYSDMTYGYAFYLTKNHHFSQDLTQQVALKTLESPTVVAKALGETYFKEAVRNLIKNDTISKNIRKTTVTDELPENATTDETKVVNDRILLEGLKRLLTPEEWKLVNMFSQGYTNAEICEEFGIVRRDVYNRLAGIRKKVEGEKAK